MALQLNAPRKSRRNKRITPAGRPSNWSLNARQRQHWPLQMKVSPIQSSEFCRLAVSKLTPITKLNRNEKENRGPSPPEDGLEPLPIVPHHRTSMTQKLSAFQDCSNKVITNGYSHESTKGAKSIVFDTSSINGEAKQCTVPAPRENAFWSEKTTAARCSPTKKRSSPLVGTPTQSKKLRVGNDGVSRKGRGKTLISVDSMGTIKVAGNAVPQSSPKGLHYALEPQARDVTNELNTVPQSIPKGIPYAIEPQARAVANEFSSVSIEPAHPFLTIARENEGFDLSGSLCQSDPLSEEPQPSLWDFLDMHEDSYSHVTSFNRPTVTSAVPDKVLNPKETIQPPAEDATAAFVTESDAIAMNPHKRPTKERKGDEVPKKKSRPKLRVATRVVQHMLQPKNYSSDQTKPTQDSKVQTKAKAEPIKKRASLKLKISQLEDKGGKMVSEVSEGERSCSCRKSKCLKLYCECFASSVLCQAGSCICNDCENSTEDGEERQKAIKKALKRNKNIFSKKPANRKERRAALLLHPKIARSGKGCKCKNTRCLKKYCECFFTKSHCSKLCVCTDCENPFGKSNVMAEKSGLKDLKKEPGNIGGTKTSFARQKKL